MQLTDHHYRVRYWLGVISLLVLSNLALTLEPQPGAITIVKEASLESTQSFQFTSTTDMESFSLIDDGSAKNRLTIYVEPGLYQVDELLSEGWALEKAICDNGDPVDAITVGAGETVECTFYNLYEVVEPPVYFQFLPFLATGQ